MPNFDEPAVPREQQTYSDFVAWRDSKNLGERVTVGDAMRRYNRTSLDTLLAWWKRDEAEQEGFAAEIDNADGEAADDVADEIALNRIESSADGQ